MKLMWIPGTKNRIVLAVAAAYVSVGAGVTVADGKEPEPFAAIDIRYRPEDFSLVSLILKAMQERSVAPEVYFWDTDKSDAELAVYFRVPNPPLTLLKSLISGESGWAEILHGQRVDELVTSGEANVQVAGGVDRFQMELEMTDRGAVIVNVPEESAAYDPDADFKIPFTKVNYEAPPSLVFE